jgi:hypothetical protein
LPDGDAAINDIAAGVDGPLRRDLGIVGPELFPGCSFDGEDFAPSGGEVHHAVDHDGSGFLAAARIQVDVPSQSELADVLVVDLR